MKKAYIQNKIANGNSDHKTTHRGNLVQLVIRAHRCS